MLFLIAQVCYGFDEDFDGRDWEEPAGVTCTALVSPEDGVYGVAFGEGVWLKHTPILGDFSISLFKNDNVGALLSGIGMTIRIMPRWKLAPFVGGVGSFAADSTTRRYPIVVSVAGAPSALGPAASNARNSASILLKASASSQCCGE